MNIVGVREDGGGAQTDLTTTPLSLSSLSLSDILLVECVCVCVYECVGDRETEREKERGRGVLYLRCVNYLRVDCNLCVCLSSCHFPRPALSGGGVFGSLAAPLP